MFSAQAIVHHRTAQGSGTAVRALRWIGAALGTRWQWSSDRVRSQ
jgi:hypothetical protein